MSWYLRNRVAIHLGTVLVAGLNLLLALHLRIYGGILALDVAFVVFGLIAGPILGRVLVRTENRPSRPRTRRASLVRWVIFGVVAGGTIAISIAIIVSNVGWLPFALIFGPFATAMTFFLLKRWHARSSRS